MLYNSYCWFHELLEILLYFWQLQSFSPPLWYWVKTLWHCRERGMFQLCLLPIYLLSLPKANSLFLLPFPSQYHPWVLVLTLETQRFKLSLTNLKKKFFFIYMKCTPNSKYFQNPITSLSLHRSHPGPDNVNTCWIIAITWFVSMLLPLPHTQHPSLNITRRTVT